MKNMEPEEKKMEETASMEMHQKGTGPILRLEEGAEPSMRMGATYWLECLCTSHFL